MRTDIDAADVAFSKRRRRLKVDMYYVCRIKTLIKTVLFGLMEGPNKQGRDRGGKDI